MKILIVGGCFVEQADIIPDRLYHQTLKNLLAEQGIAAEIQTLRYERITNTLNKINQIRQGFEFDCLLFHLRAEPMLRISKFYYKFKNEQNHIQHSINLPLRGWVNPEKHELLRSRRIVPSAHTENTWRAGLRNINNLLGKGIGNQRHALGLYQKFVLDLHRYCQNVRSGFLLLGPVLRPCSDFENAFSIRISSAFAQLAYDKELHYLELLKKETRLGEPMFCSNKINVSQEGHDEIAWMILEYFQKEILVANCQGD